MPTRIGLFILQHFLYVSCLRTVITNGPAHCLKGELAEPNVAIYLQNHRLFWRIFIKPDLAVGRAYMDGKNSAVCRNLSDLLKIFQSSQTRQTQCRESLLSNRQFIWPVPRPTPSIFLRLFLYGQWHVCRCANHQAGAPWNKSVYTAKSESSGYWHPMGWRWCIRSGFFITPYAVTADWINIVSPGLYTLAWTNDTCGGAPRAEDSRYGNHAGHYTKTLKQWRQALRQNNATIGQDYDERFIRMWKFTLLAANISFAVRME